MRQSWMTKAKATKKFSPSKSAAAKARPLDLVLRNPTTNRGVDVAAGAADARKERGEKQPDRDDADDQEMDLIDDEKDRGDEIEGRESSRGEPRRTSSDEDGDQDEREDGIRSNKNLHREVTPWAEAIGFIVNSNLEARARAPSGGAPRGRWTKGDRRG